MHSGWCNIPATLTTSVWCCPKWKNCSPHHCYNPGCFYKHKLVPSSPKASLVRELILEVQSDQKQKAVTILAKAASHTQSFPVFLEILWTMYVSSSCRTVSPPRYYSLYTELVKELTLQVQNQQQQKAVKTVRTLGKAASHIKSFPVFFKRKNWSGNWPWQSKHNLSTSHQPKTDKRGEPHYARTKLTIVMIQHLP